MDDNVNTPTHYLAHPSGLECIQITEHHNFNVGNTIKYLWRHDTKGNPITDLRKAEWYLRREIRRVAVEGHATISPWHGLDALWRRLIHAQPDGHLRDAYRNLAAAGGQSDPHSRRLFAAAYHVHCEIKALEGQWL